MDNSITVSVIIKALNEEIRIASAIESAMRALDGLSGEIILADSGSTDSTVTIAAKYPVQIVQIIDESDRRCGIGPQLGFQFSRGKFVYILDGDMQIDPDFIELALKTFEDDPQLAGVAGLVEEHISSNWHFRGRVDRNLEGIPGPAKWLDMGGLYRREALESVGYFSNRNLYSCEEQELGLRLVANGWRLVRLPVKSIDHFGHNLPTLLLLYRRWQSGYLFGAGQLIRSAIGTSWLGATLMRQKHLLLVVALSLLLVASLVIWPLSLELLILWCLLIFSITTQRIVRHKSVKDGLLSIVVWHINAIAMVCGFLLPQKNPRTRINAKLLKG